MKRRKESESCGSCYRYYVGCEYPEEGFCNLYNNIPVTENNWCYKYEYDGYPLIFSYWEESHANCQ